MQGSKMLELLAHFHDTEHFFIMEENHRNLTLHIEIMASKREADNSMLIHNIKKMRICWNSILREEKGNDCFQSISNKQPYTEWLTLGIGPRREDGSSSNKDPRGKGKAIASEEKADSRSRDVYKNYLTLKIGLCTEDGSNKHIYAMDGDKEAEYKGETSSNREDDWDESISVHSIPEDVLNTIFCKLPLHTLFQIQIVSPLWQSIISSSSYFHNLWEQSNLQSWLVMDLCDETSGCSNGLALYDIGRRLRYMKIFGEEWNFSNSQWFLRAADGGLLVYSCRRNGKIRVLNPLTMQSFCLEDAKVTRKSKLSFYLKKYHDDVAVNLKCDPEQKTYQVIAIIGNLYLLRRKLFVVLIYRSQEQKWEIREVRLEGRVSGHMTISFFPSIFMQNQNIYWFSRKGIEVGKYDLNGDGNIRLLYFWGVNVHEPLGIVMYKAKMIMACKGEQMELPPYTHPLILYELDELERNWKPKYEAILSPRDFISGTICVVGDYIWIIEESDGHVSHLICIDPETGELKVWPEVYPFMFNVRKCLSMPLSFCGCS